MSREPSFTSTTNLPTSQCVPAPLIVVTKNNSHTFLVGTSEKSKAIIYPDSGGFVISVRTSVRVSLSAVLVARLLSGTCYNTTSVPVRTAALFYRFPKKENHQHDDHENQAYGLFIETETVVMWFQIQSKSLECVRK